MDLTFTSKTIGATPSTNGGLNSLNKIEASCFFERARLDVFKKVADLLVKPKMTVSGWSENDVAPCTYRSPTSAVAE